MPIILGPVHISRRTCACTCVDISWDDVRAERTCSCSRATKCQGVLAELVQSISVWVGSDFGCGVKDKGTLCSAMLLLCSLC